VTEPRRGYGSACLAGIAALRAPDVVVFLDGDNSDHAEELPALIAPIAQDRADLVIGSRTLGRRQAGSLTPQQVLGNRLACFLLRLLYRQRFTDLGPFRAVRHSSLLELGMSDPDYGWTVEMQIKAVRRGLRIVEVPVSYRPRIGRSKISGTLRGSLLAGHKILTTIARHALR
jgi:glycosyltransferase involved in cell wall biosynthesis